MTRPKQPVHFAEVAKLQPYEKNARTHSRSQIEQVKESIRRFGFVGTLAYDDKGLAIGHCRQIALTEMWAAGEDVYGPGKRELLPVGRAPAVDISGLTDDERRALIIADNKLALNAGWDEDLLSAEIRALIDGEFDMPVIGFDDTEIEKLLRGLRQNSGDAEQIPPAPAVPVSRVGDLWILGDHRLLCGNSTERADVERVLDGKAADLCLTDPPYGIGFAYRDHDDTDPEANALLVADVFALAPAAKVWTPGSMNLGRDLLRFGPARAIYWHKGFAAAGNGLGGASTVEPILVLNPPAKNLPNDYLDFKTDREKLGDKMLGEYHPCPKPVALFAHLAECLSGRGAVIYEPFGGSGTTMIACEQTRRHCRSIEIDPVYVDVAVARWQQLTGQKAILEGADLTFEQIGEQRLAPPPD